MPGLAKLLRRSPINVFTFNTIPIDTTSPWPHLIRLFANGSCLLITESLFLRRPKDALRILRWFRLVQLGARAPGTWKIALRQRPIEWLLRMMDAFEPHQSKFPGVYQLFADICSELAFMLFSNGGNTRTLVTPDDVDVPLPEAPIICPKSLKALDEKVGWKGNVRTNTDVSPEDIVNNDEALVKWFAETSTLRFEQFRKFNIIIGYDRDDEKGKEFANKWGSKHGYLEAMTAEEYCKLNNVTSAASLEEMELDRQKKVREEAPRKKAAAAQAKRKLLESRAATIRRYAYKVRESGVDEDTVLSMSKDLMASFGCTEEEIERFEILDHAGSVVLPNPEDEHAWTRELDRYGRVHRGGGSMEEGEVAAAVDEEMVD